MTPLCLLLDDGERRLALGVRKVEGIGPLEVEGELGRLGERAVSVLSREAIFREVDLAFDRGPVLQSQRQPKEEA